MEMNWKVWKLGVMLALMTAALNFLNAITAFQTPPDWWPLLRLAVVPALTGFFTTMIQACPKPGGALK